MRAPSVGMATLTAPAAGAAIPLAGRTRGTASLLVASGTATVTLEAAGALDQSVWDVLSTVVVTAPGKTAIALDEDVAVESWHAFVRWHVTATTNVTLGADVDLPFVDAVEDRLLFSQELREWKDGLVRTIDEAELDILGELYQPAPLYPRIGSVDRLYDRPSVRIDPAVAELIAGAVTTPCLTIDLAQPGVGEDMRRAIIAQAEHRYRRHKLQLASDPASIVTLRNLGDLAPGVMRALDKRRNRAVTAWRGR